MKTVKSCEFNIDTACVDVVYENGSILSIYTPMIEKSLRTTVYSHSRLDLLIESDPFEYVRMVIDGTMQNYLDEIDGIIQRQMKSYIKRLEERFSPNIAEDIASEIIMYS